MSLEAGQTLSHYRLIEKIGAGGMGVVWRARDTSLDRDVAIKILPVEFAAETARLARFEQEAKAVAALNHPNIVTVHSVEKDTEGIHFFTMELVGGKQLSRRIPRGGLPVERFLELAIPLADAISAAHERGITHRDLKPANIMVTTEGRVKVLDFGLAKLRRDESTVDSDAPTRAVSLTTDGRLLGTIPYMSPEQIEGKPVDHRSDLFSLGIVLYEMATGRHPFVGDSHAAVMSAILRDSPASVTELRPELPGDLGRIISHCLRKDPERRYQTAKDLRNEIAELQETSRSASSSQETDVTGGTRRIGALVLGTMAILLAVVLSYSLWQRSTTVPDSDTQRIVVLPFENLGPTEESYFASGMTDEIGRRLAVASGISVISRTSAKQYAGTDATIEQIGRELNVGYVLEGTVRWAHKVDGARRVRITPQLIRVADDTQVWSHTYDEDFEDVFIVQSEIAARVAEELDVVLLEPERVRLESVPTEDLEAYDFYLRGLDYYFTGTNSREHTTMAAEMFQKAVESDPNFTLGHAALSRAHAVMYSLYIDHTDGRRALAKAAIDRALELDPDSPWVRKALAHYYYSVEQDSDRALIEATRIANQLPNDVDLLGLIIGISRRQGRWDEAVNSARRAYELSPRDAAVVRDLARTLFFTRRYEESEKYFDRLIELSPDQPVFYQLKATLYRTWKGTTKEARAILEEMPDTGRASEFWRWQLVLEGDYSGAMVLSDAQLTSPLSTRAADEKLLVGLLHGWLNAPQEAREAFESARLLLQELILEQPDNALVLSKLGLVQAHLGNKGEAIRAGLEAVERHSVSRDALGAAIYAGILAEIYTVVGEYDKALERLEYLLSNPSYVSIPLLRLDPRWKPLWDHPRFVELVARHEAERATKSDV